MADQRRPSIYDPARDMFTKSDDASADGADHTPTDPSSANKRKRVDSEAVASESPHHVKPSSPSHKRVKTSPAAASASQNGPKLNSANLSSITAKKKAPSERSEAPRKKEPLRRKREDGPGRSFNDSGRRAQRTPPRPPRDPSPIRSPSPIRDNTPPRRHKRPGAGARLNNADAAAAKRRMEEREAQEKLEAQKIASQRQGLDIVSQHYNAVPQRGREWRSTGSKIKGLRSFNNWVKSALIQKFSPGSSYKPGAMEQGRLINEYIKVLDIGCGKGGDLQKWQAAPQPVGLYFGLDPAEVSIHQARDRHREMVSNARRFRNKRDRRAHEFDARFFTRDCFGSSFADIESIRHIGFDPAAGPESGYNPHAAGGFDVVSMMFCLHYAFENEERARIMLKNVSGALKKGGRFLGVMPNSKVLTDRIINKGKASFDAAKPKPKPSDALNYDDEVPAAAKVSEDNNNDDDDDDDDDDDWDPEKPVDDTSRPLVANGDDEDDDDDWDPEKPCEPKQSAANGDAAAASASDAKDASPKASNTPIEPTEWGNGIYHVRYPGKPPADGIWRPIYGHKYFFFLEEAVEEVPEYVVPWEGFRALALDYDLELSICKPFTEMWDDFRYDAELGPLSERMRVVNDRGEFQVSNEEMEAASFYMAFCFYKV